MTLTMFLRSRPGCIKYCSHFALLFLYCAMRQNCVFGLTIWYIASISRRCVCNYWTCLNWWCNVYGYFELFIKHILLINQRISQLVPGMPHILPMLQHWVPWIFKMYLKKTFLHFPSWQLEAGHDLFFINITNIICMQVPC